MLAPRVASEKRLLKASFASVRPSLMRAKACFCCSALLNVGFASSSSAASLTKRAATSRAGLVAERERGGLEASGVVVVVVGVVVVASFTGIVFSLLEFERQRRGIC